MGMSWSSTASALITITWLMAVKPMVLHQHWSAYCRTGSLSVDLISCTALSSTSPAGLTPPPFPPHTDEKKKKPLYGEASDEDDDA